MRNATAPGEARARRGSTRAGAPTAPAWIAAILAAASAACGPPGLHCDFTEAGVCYAVEAGDLAPEGARRAREQAEKVWGPGVLAGWTVHLAPTTGCTASSDACALLDDRVIVIRWVCPCSMGLLIHEAGHAAIGDARHVDPRWHSAREAEVEAERQCRED